MSDTDNSLQLTPEQELEALKTRADRLGIKYHPSIGLEALSAKVREKLAEAGPSTGGAGAGQNQVQTQTPPADKGQGSDGAGTPSGSANTDMPAAPVQETEGQRRKRIKNEQLALVRIRVTCMNPNKREWQGEMITAGNRLVGHVTKFVPFNGADEGWHVPRIILNVMRERKCQVFETTKTRNGVSMRKGRLINEFAIEELPMLTEQELKDLAQRQAMAGSIDKTAA